MTSIRNHICTLEREISTDLQAQGLPRLAAARAFEARPVGAYKLKLSYFRASCPSSEDEMSNGLYP